MKKKIFLALFTLVIMLTLCIAISAEDAVEWTVSEDGKTLIVGDEAYKLYEGYLYPTDMFYPTKAFIYENKLSYTYYLKQNDDYDGIMVLSSSSYSGPSFESIYVNSEGEEYLDRFVSKYFSLYKLRYGDLVANAPASWISSINGGELVYLDVRDLQYLDIFEVLGYDKSGTFAHKIGAVYANEDGYYYVNYDKLPNNYFDASGNFSYRQGTVRAYKLNATQASDMTEYINNMQSLERIYENEDSFDGLGKGFSTVYFVIITAIFGFIMPLAPVVIGTYRIIKGKSRNPKRWYLLFIGCALWIVSSIGILLTLIF